jgi:nitrate/nitrite transporter NarK
MKTIMPLFTILSALSAGLLGDFYEEKKKNFKARALFASLSCLMPLPFCYLAYILQSNFWLSLISIYLATLLGEQYHSSSITMINKLMPGNLQGLATAIYFMTGNLAAFIS